MALQLQQLAMVRRRVKQPEERRFPRLCGGRRRVRPRIARHSRSRRQKDFTVNSLLAAAYDSYLTWFEKPVPCLIKAWDEASADNPLKTKLAEQIGALRG